MRKKVTFLNQFFVSQSQKAAGEGPMPHIQIDDSHTHKLLRQFVLKEFSVPEVEVRMELENLNLPKSSSINPFTGVLLAFPPSFCYIDFLKIYVFHFLLFFIFILLILIYL